ncbi:MAG TPA: VTT domain-containing protein [Anaerolineaceae bacterium]|nr:VTT domain-containing protein [Anaerolineaceae bacterium]
MGNNTTHEENSRRKPGNYIHYILFALVLVAAFIFALHFNVSQLKDFLQKYEQFGVAIVLLVYAILGVTPIPSEPVTLLVLAWKGPVAAILLATVGNTLAAIVEFHIGSGVDDLTDFEKKKEKLPFHLGKLPINSPAFLILARMLPGFGSKFVSIVSGVYKVPLSTYLWTTVVSNLIGETIFVLSSYGLIGLLR